MSTFINTVESVGDAALTASIVNRTITELADDISVSIGEGAFRKCGALTNVNFPNVTSIATAAFYQCTALAKADFASCVAFGNNSFYGCTALIALILRNTEQISTLTGNLSGTAIASGTGYIYVPLALVDAYKAASGWSTYAAQIRAIEDYPEVCDPYTWDTVFKCIDNGTYSSVYKIGDLVPLDLGTEGKVNMQIAGFDVDTLADGGGTAPISWVSKELLATRKRMNPKEESIVNTQIVPSWIDNGNAWVSQNEYSPTNAVATWEITAEEDQTLSIAYNASYFNSSYQGLDISVNDVLVVDNYASVTAAEYNVEMKSGDVVTVKASYYLNSTQKAAAKIIFTSTGAFDIAANVDDLTVNKKTGEYKYGTGTIGGWEQSEMRKYLTESIIPLIPEAVCNRLSMVTKIQPATEKDGALYTQTTQDVVWIPAYDELVNGYKLLFGSTEKRVKAHIDNGAIYAWHTRTAQFRSGFYAVILSGGINDSYGAENYAGIALGFCT